MDKIWNNFPGCECLKFILMDSGYENLASLKCINDKLLSDLEKYVEENRSILDNLTCNHKNKYLQRKTFEFLPGHRALLIDWCENQLKDYSNDAFTRNHPAFSTILRELIGSALNNQNKPIRSHRYSEKLIDFSIYLFIMAGKACYETISLNLPIPKSSTILKRIHTQKERIVEGELRCEALSKHLERTNSPKSVFLSEDGSGILKKVVYDPKSNQLTGLVLPMNEKNGMPIIYSFKATSAEMIKKHMEEPHANLVYIIVAQTLNENAEPFILQMFGTDNKFETSSVLKRWMHTEDELKKYGIEVIGFAADGDNRLLKAMRTRMRFDLIPDIEIIKRCDGESACCQDTVHVGTKFRNRLLNKSIVLCIGNKTVSAVHIHTLVDTVEKSIHGLVKSDIFPEDRQNYRSLEKLMEDRISNALNKYIPHSEATVMYLSICKHITSSYLQPNLMPTERIYNIWYGLYFLRGWRKWLLSQKDYSLKDNFISSNAYICVEINAHALIEIIVKLREKNQANLFKPLSFSSQPCESIFRMMRSMGTINFTKINFNLYELLHMIARVEMSNKIAYSNKDIEFARIAREIETKDSLQMPSNLEILNEMEKARKNAIAKMAEFGIFLSENEITHNKELQCAKEKTAKEMMAMFPNECESDWFSDSEEESDSEPELGSTIDLIDPDGEIKKVRKSTFLWMLSESNDKLSADRLKRVRGSTSTETNSPLKKLKPNDFFSDDSNVLKLNELKIGDWALFDLDKEVIPSSFNTNHRKGHFIANVIGFRKVIDDRLNRSKRSTKQYKMDYVSIEKLTDKKNIEVLAIWYFCQENTILEHCNGKLTITIEKYIGTIKSPVVRTDSGIVNNVLNFKYTELDTFVRDSQRVS